MQKSTNKNSNLASLSLSSKEDAKNYVARISKERTNKDSFGSQVININEYILSPEGWENIILTLYVMFIPYAVGILFLFVFIAEVAFDKFLLLDISSIFIIWAIGYEVIAVTLLFLIFFSFVLYLKKSKTKSNNPH